MSRLQIEELYFFMRPIIAVPDSHYETKLTANSWIALSSSTNVVRISSVPTTKRFPLRCAPTAQTVRG